MEPIKAQLRAMGWVMEKLEQTLNWTKITYKVEIEPNEKINLGITGGMYGAGLRDDDPDNGGGTHEPSLAALRKGKRKPAVRVEHRKRRGKGQAD